MKTFINLSLVAVLLFSFGCSKKEETKLTAFNAEAFAYDLSDGWELNSTVRVKGIQFKEEKLDEKRTTIKVEKQSSNTTSYSAKEEQTRFVSSLEFSVDLVIPKGDTVKSIFKGTDKKENMEKVSDLPLEVQVNLDSTYKAGKYKVIFNIKDNFSGQKTTAEKEFEISKE